MDVSYKTQDVFESTTVHFSSKIIKNFCKSCWRTFHSQLKAVLSEKRKRKIKSTLGKNTVSNIRSSLGTESPSYFFEKICSIQFAKMNKTLSLLSCAKKYGIFFIIWKSTEVKFIFLHGCKTINFFYGVKVLWIGNVKPWKKKIFHSKDVNITELCYKAEKSWINLSN